jgi:hypothetical protein
MVLASHETSNLLNETPVVNAFEYLSVLISIILALGVGEMLQARSRHHIYWVHAIWIISYGRYTTLAVWSISQA